MLLLCKLLKTFYRISPLSRSGLVVEMSVCGCVYMSPSHVILPGEQRRSQVSKGGFSQGFSRDFSAVSKGFPGVFPGFYRVFPGFSQRFRKIKKYIFWEKSRTLFFLFKKKKNHATSPKLYRSYYPHRLRDSVSPVCGIFYWRESPLCPFNWDMLHPCKRWNTCMYLVLKLA